MAANSLNVISRIYKRFVHSNLTIYLMLFYLNLSWPIDDKIAQIMNFQDWLRSGKSHYTRKHLQMLCVYVCVYVCVCVYVHPPWRFHRSGTSGTAREQINDVVLKTLDSSTVSLHLYFGMQSLIFQLAALSCSYTRSGHSHDLTSIRLAFRT